EHDRTDGRGTSGAEPAGGEPEWPGGRWASGAADLPAGGGPYLGAGPRQIGLQRDPDFERKAADIIGLYMNPPAHAAVFCVDEKTAIQALDRKDPVLPLSPGRAERHGFEY